MDTIKIKKSLLFLFSAVLLFSSCSEDETDTFSGETNVYFSLKRWSSSGRTYTLTNYQVEDVSYSGEWSTIKEARDSMIVSLAFDGTEEGYHVTLIPVSISGNVVDYDRPLSCTIGANTTAVKGEHFEIADEYSIIPANKRIGAIAVMLNRANFIDKIHAIDVNLIPNVHFQTNYTTIERSAADTTKVNMQQFRLYVSSFLEEPSSWTTNYLGTFSRKKVYLVLELTGGDINEFYPEIGTPDVSLMIAWGKVLKKYLTDKKAAGETVYEEDGVTEMTAGRYA